MVGKNRYYAGKGVHPTRGRFRTVLATSLSLNLAFACAGGAWLLKRIGGGVSESPYYEAYTSVFTVAVPTHDVDAAFAGDSLTARGLRSEFFPDLEVANRGIGSDTSEGLLGRLDTIVGCDPETVVVMIGINDLGQGVEEDEICGNVSELLDRLADQLPSSHVVLMGVLPAGNVDDGRVVSLNARYEGLAESRPGVTFLDLHDKYLDDGGERDASLYDDDGVHLNGRGYRIWIEAISTLL